MLATGRPVRRGSRRARAVRGKARSRRPASRMPTGVGTASAGNPVRRPRVGQGPAAPGCLAGPRRDCFGGRRCDACRRDFGTSRRCASARRSGPIPAGPGLPAFGPRRPGRRAGRNHARTARAGQAVHQASRTGLQRFERSPATIRDWRPGQPAGAAAAGAAGSTPRWRSIRDTGRRARHCWNWRDNKSGTKRRSPLRQRMRPHEVAPTVHRDADAGRRCDGRRAARRPASPPAAGRSAIPSRSAASSRPARDPAAGRAPPNRDHFRSHGREFGPAVHRRDGQRRAGLVRLRRGRADRYLPAQRGAAAGRDRRPAASQRLVPQRRRVAVPRCDRGGRRGGYGLRLGRGRRRLGQ